MEITPADVLPLLVDLAADLEAALRVGIAYADQLQQGLDKVTPWYWSHGARWRARRFLLDNPEAEVKGYTLVDGVPNSGIRIRVHDLHVVRVVRSFAGSTPHPGPNLARRLEWFNSPVQNQLTLAENGSLPPLNLIVDWQHEAGEPVLHVGLPRGEWSYKQKPILFWRKPLTSAVDLQALRFESAEAQLDEQLIQLDIDETEFGVDGG